MADWASCALCGCAVRGWEVGDRCGDGKADNGTERAGVVSGSSAGAVRTDRTVVCCWRCGYGTGGYMYGAERKSAHRRD